MKKKKLKSLVLSGNGINCEYETAHAHRLVGFDADIVHINELMEGTRNIHDYTFLNLPGGFLDGDDLGAGRAFWAASSPRLINSLTSYNSNQLIPLKSGWIRTSACLALCSAIKNSVACKVRTTISAILGVRIFDASMPKRKPKNLNGCLEKGISRYTLRLAFPYS